LIVALIILAVGGGMSIIDGVRHILHPEPISKVTWNYATLAASALFEGASLRIAITEFRKVVGPSGVLDAIHASKDPTNFSVMLEDIAALLGLMVAFFGILLTHTFHVAWADGAAAILIGVILSAVAAALAYETHGCLSARALRSRCLMRFRG
jgi:divalent metal cation (Fe/Co/Zn/Cd) transporter